MGGSPPLALDAVAELEEELGVDVRVASLTLALTRVDVLVPTSGRSGSLDAYRYGTSGAFGGRGFSGPTPVAADPGDLREGAAFDPDDAGLEHLDAVVDDARAVAALPGAWVARVEVRRDATAGEPRTTVTVSDGLRTAA